MSEKLYRRVGKGNVFFGRGGFLQRERGEYARAEDAERKARAWDAVMNTPGALRPAEYWERDAKCIRESSLNEDEEWHSLAIAYNALAAALRAVEEES